MAICNIIRRAAGHAAGAARSIARAQRYHHRQYSSMFSAAAAAANRGGVSGSFVRSAVPSAFHHYSTKSDEALLKVIESEINAHIESEGTNEAEDVPTGFPFKIEDNPGYQTVTLRREYQDEDITVEVHMPDLVSGDEGNDRMRYNDDDDEQDNNSQIPLVVCVSKKNGPALEFGCTALPDEISIDSLSFRDPKSDEDNIAYEGPDFLDLDENLQKAFHKYLEIRGIKPSTTNFLHEYMIDKDGREYLMWLQNIKKFIQA
ncbi:unnamed protein product [Cuscuta campestris]|uniref:Mitochondrial glycoprotein domain-containing protein n=1 Tax=Cuscuta campestris TaxID=132261 RepID=A0A484NDY1_9ASTE|nr:unnamed protein product [Cuscuta campestris]